MRGSSPLVALRSAPVTAMIWLRGVSVTDCAGGTEVGVLFGSGVGVPVPVPGVLGGVVMIVPVLVGVGVSVKVPVGVSVIVNDPVGV
jgi:hypothetical protein